MSTEKQQAWWTQVPDQVAGDRTAAQQPSRSRSVVESEDITEAVYAVLGHPAPSDRQAIDARLAEMTSALERIESAFSSEFARTARSQWTALSGELTKTEENEHPDPSLIIQSGDWLLENIPSIAQPLADLIAMPEVGRVLGKSGPTVRWVKNRFG